MVGAAGEHRRAAGCRPGSRDGGAGPVPSIETPQLHEQCDLGAEPDGDERDERSIGLQLFERMSRSLGKADEPEIHREEAGCSKHARRDRPECE